MTNKMCDKNNISAYHISSKFAVFDNLTACKINGQKYTTKQNLSINLQIISSTNVNINSDSNYVLINNNIIGNNVYLPKMKCDHSIKIKNESLGPIIITGNFSNGSPNYTINSNSSNEFIYYAKFNYWIVF